jgi:DNA-binding MarR family transcriptional regulator
VLSEYQKIIKQMNDAFEEFGILIANETKKIDQFDLTMQQDLILAYIAKHLNVTANEIAHSFSITKSAVSQVLSKLEQNKMIVRAVNPQNKRESFISLGENGEKYVSLLQDLDIKLIKNYYSKVDLEDLTHMTRTMEKINEVIKAKNKTT